MALKGNANKGGTRFPKYSLKQLVPNLKDLLSKTHTNAITIEQLNSGVFGTKPKSPSGEVRYSALKQFGLADGLHAAIRATELASKIVYSENEERATHLRTALFQVKTFKNSFETFQGSTANKAKIKGYVISSLKVHPDSADKFLEAFLPSAELANVCSINNDEVTFHLLSEVTAGRDAKPKSDDDKEISESTQDEIADNDGGLDSDAEPLESDDTNQDDLQSRGKSRAANIDIKIDPSLDADKLEKQLKVLRKYGLI